VHADVWSVTSWNELRRDGLEVESWNFLHPGEAPREAYVTRRLAGRPGPVVAVSDWMRAVQDQIREWVPGDFSSLGTDGFGMSDTRGALRRHFKVDAESITLRTLEMLARRGEVDADFPRQAFERYQLADVRAADPGAGMGDA
jgi:pyruvate dehydrogenase E1 component